MRKTRIFGQKFSVLGIGNGGGGSLPPKIINVPADYPTLIEATKNMGRHYYIGGDPSVTDNDPTKTNTGQTFLLGQDIMWDGISAYFKVGDNAIWVLDGAGNVKTITPQNINMQGKGLKDINLWTTVGSADADYTLIQAAIDAGKTNLLIIGDYTNSETVVTGANKVTICILKKWTMNEGYITIGAGGLKIEGHLEAIYTLVADTPFLGSGKLELHNFILDMSACTTATSRLSNLTIGTQHIVTNGKILLPNNDGAYFSNPANESSFTNLHLVGGGSLSNGFLSGADDVIISDIICSGTWDASRIFISSLAGSTRKFILSNLVSSSANELLIFFTGDKPQVSNLRGKFTPVLLGSSNGNFVNLDVENLDFSSGTCDNIYFTNCKFNGISTISIPNDWNQFVNCGFAGDVILTAASNNNQLLECIAVGGFTDNGTNNAIIEEVSEDVLMTSDSNRKLITEHVAKTYADNIAKGITVDYYFSDTPDGAIANYDIMFPTDTGQAQSTAAASIVAADTLIQTFITQTTEPNFTTLLAGIYDIHIHAAKTAGTKDAFIYAKFYKRTHPGGVETLLATSDNSSLLTSENVGYTLHFSLVDDEILNATDRLVVKFYGSPSGVGTDPTATLYLEGTNASRIDIHTTSSSWMLNLQNVIYRNGAGNDSNDGKNMGTPKLTLAAAITAAIAQSPSSSNMITIKDLGGARINEDITLPSWVILDTSDAHVIGQVTLGITMAADSHFYFNKASPEAGSQCVRISGSGTRYIRGNSTGAALNSTFIAADSGAVVYLDIVNANAVATGAKFYTFATGAVLFINAQTFRETVASTSSGATVFRNIVDDGANADTSSINETGNHIIRGKDKVSLGTLIVPNVVDIEGIGAKWNTRPHFIAYNASQIPNVTGDGTVYDIVLTSVDANVGMHYATTSGLFTAPTTGLYLFNIVLVLNDMDAAAYSDVNIRLVRTGTAATWYLRQVNPDKIIVGGYLGLNGSIEMKLNSGDTAKFQVQVVGGTKSVDVEQGTTFSGRLLTKV